MHYLDKYSMVYIKYTLLKHQIKEMENGFFKTGSMWLCEKFCNALVRLPNYEVGYTVLKSANVSVVSRRARRGEHGDIRLGLEFRRGRRHLSKM